MRVVLTVDDLILMPQLDGIAVYCGVNGNGLPAFALAPLQAAHLPVLVLSQSVFAPLRYDVQQSLRIRFEIVEVCCSSRTVAVVFD